MKFYDYYICDCSFNIAFSCVIYVEFFRLLLMKITLAKGTSALIWATCRQEEVYCSVFQEFSKQFNKQTNGKHGYSPVTEFFQIILIVSHSKLRCLVISKGLSSWNVSIYYAEEIEILKYCYCCELVICIQNCRKSI